MNVKTLLMTIAILGTVGCADATNTEPVDGDNAPFHVAIDGRGDSNGVVVSMDEIELILEIANTYHYNELDAFLDARAAKNIVNARADELFTSLDQLDDVGYVGARAFKAFLKEARTFVGGDYDVRDYFEANESNRLTELKFRGALGAQLAEQPFVGRFLACDASSDCAFAVKFEEIRDYSNTAGPGNIVMSFRTENASNSRENRSLTAMAQDVIESRNDGPMACTKLPRGTCVPLYGCGTTQYRCNVRIPE